MLNIYDDLSPFVYLLGVPKAPRCEAGKYSNYEGASSCFECWAGTYPDDNATECLSCPEGKYAAQVRPLAVPCVPAENFRNIRLLHSVTPVVVALMR